MLRFLPPGVLEILLFLVLVGIALLVLRAFLRRHSVAPPVGAEEREPLPSLETPQRVTGNIRRTVFDRGEGAWLSDIKVGNRKLTFAAADYASQRQRYQDLNGQDADIALYGLATLAPGGVEAMRDQIRDIDSVEITPNLVRLVPAGEYPNDYVVIAKVLSHRDDALTDGTPLYVYRSEVVRSPDTTLVLDLATPREDGAAPFADQEMVHGSVRLYGYLAAG